MKSMTGFGRSEFINGNHKISVEIKTVNNRFLDFNIRSPKILLFLDDAIRAEVKKYLVRGRVDLFINYETVGDVSKSVVVDTAMVRAYINAANEISEITGISSEIPMETLIRLPEVIKYDNAVSDEEGLKSTLISALDIALEQLTEARQTEGYRMVADLLERVETLRKYLSEIEEREPLVVEEYKQKLSDKIKSLTENGDFDENRFYTEVLYFSDRASITEEIVRLKSHFDQCETILKSNSSQGRNLDFIIQEMNREFNTIGSKSTDLKITNSVIAAKGEVEKIREQIQNIE